MSVTCPSCGTLNAADHRFCLHCGSDLTSPGTASQQQGSAPPEQPAATYRVQRWVSPQTGEEIPGPPNVYAPDSDAFPPYVPPPPGAAFRSGSGSSRYADVASAAVRQPGAAYAPYSTEAVAGLDKAETGHSWLWPVVVVSALLLLGLGAVSGYLMVTSRGGAAPPPVASNTPASKTPLPANASEEDRVKEAVRQSNDGQITAWRTLDTEVLKATRTGKVLRDDTAVVDQLRQKGMYAVPVNERLDILDVKVTGDTATAKTFESWSVTFYEQGTNKKVQSQGPDTYTETYYLVKQGGKWLISDLVINTENSTPTAR